MISRTAILIGAIIGAVACVPLPSVAQPSQPQPPSWSASFEDEMLTLESPDGEQIIRPNRRRLVAKFEGRHEIEFMPRPAGADFEVTLHNPKSEPISCGSLIIGGFRLGHVVSYRDVRKGTTTMTWDNKGTTFFPTAFLYPDQTYSPVSVFSNGDYTFGLSLHYPVLEYKHSVQMHLLTPGGMYINGGNNWEHHFRLQGDLAPGETRTYTLSLRVTQNDRRWLETLEPYREYFTDLYGGVQYQRDPRPVLQYTMSQASVLSNTNPYGFSTPRRRPDIYGWRPTADNIRELNARGFERIVMWTPTGLYRNHRDYNFPFQFMTQMRNVPEMKNSMSELRALVADGIDMGYWWGRSVQVMNSWDPDDGWAPLDPENPDHVRRAFAELDLAASLGASMIGLDTFGKIPAWESYRWLETMRDRHPSVMFVTEPSKSDILHTLAATYIFDSLNQADDPKVLADFLLPGHETWAQLNFTISEGRLKRRMTEAEQRTEIERIARNGYVPVIAGYRYRLDNPDFNAAESWTETVPRELRPERVGASAPGEATGIQEGRVLRASGVAVAPRSPGRDSDVMNAGLTGPGTPPSSDRVLNPTRRRLLLMGPRVTTAEEPAVNKDNNAPSKRTWLGDPARRRHAAIPFSADAAREALRRAVAHEAGREDSDE